MRWHQFWRKGLLIYVLKRFLHWEAGNNFGGVPVLCEFNNYWVKKLHGSLSVGKQFRKLGKLLIFDIMIRVSPGRAPSHHKERARHRNSREQWVLNLRKSKSLPIVIPNFEYLNLKITFHWCSHTTTPCGSAVLVIFFIFLLLCFLLYIPAG